MKFFFLLLLPIVAYSFPENVKHGYVNCTSCHVSPGGGGILTPYGRGLSNEVVSTWGSEDETKFLWGAIPLPTWLDIGGDVRWVQTYKDTPSTRTAETIFMQADLEAAATYDRLYLVLSGGKSNVRDPMDMGEAFVSHRHYLGYRFTDTVQVRAGKFNVPYGIYSPEHTLVTRKGIGFDENSETYNLEASYLGEDFDVFVAGSAGRPDNKTLDAERGFVLRGGPNFAESIKVGASYANLTRDTQKRQLLGPYAIVGLSKEWMVLGEMALQNTVPAATDSYWGWVNYLKVDYELTKGVHLFATNEISHLNFNLGTHAHSYGLGAQWFPRPHFEVMGAWRKLKVNAQWDSYTDFAYLLLHYYF